MVRAGHTNRRKKAKRSVAWRSPRGSAVGKFRGQGEAQGWYQEVCACCCLGILLIPALDVGRRFQGELLVGDDQGLAGDASLVHAPRVPAHTDTHIDAAPRHVLFLAFSSGFPPAVVVAPGALTLSLQAERSRSNRKRAEEEKPQAHRAAHHRLCLMKPIERTESNQTVQATPCTTSAGINGQIRPNPVRVRPKNVENVLNQEMMTNMLGGVDLVLAP